MSKVSLHWIIRIYFWILILLLILFSKSPFDFMVLNTFLGYLPIEISFQLRRFNDRRSLAFWCLLIVWMIFYPNAPYVVTDLMHLSLLHPYTSVNGILKDDPKIWLTFAMMIVCAMSCFILGSLSLSKVARQLTDLTTPQHPRLKNLWIVIFSLLAGVGIYIGRFLRLHSAYLIFTPSWFWRQLFGIWSLKMVEFVLIMSAMQLLIYWLLKIFQRASSEI
ncbi:MAG: DUF1361 domain-containing protein [Limosilactobacillus sp.]|uniref:DUF1361 domain-containing protein n=1 Tax=Limosilactobacillus sp. TaxID=2773925 RepID=UPI0026FB98F6|nr:DUF1361 domain-containing protein [Limosilactobacillus sp.]